MEYILIRWICVHMVHILTFENIYCDMSFVDGIPPATLRGLLRRAYACSRLSQMLQHLLLPLRGASPPAGALIAAQGFACGAVISVLCGSTKVLLIKMREHFDVTPC